MDHIQRERNWNLIAVVKHIAILYVPLFVRHTLAVVQGATFNRDLDICVQSRDSANAVS